MKVIHTLKSLLSSALVALCFISTPAKAQIPTTDLANLTTQLQQIAAQYADYVAQYEHYKKIVDQLKSVTGVRDIKALLGLQEVKDAMSKADLDAITALAGDFGQFENPANDKNIAALKNITSKSFERINSIKQYERQAGQTMDDKEAQALNAKIAAEQLKLMNEMINANALQSMALAKEKQIANKKVEELFKFYMGKSKNVMTGTSNAN
jgi:Type IV secretion system proteins